MLVVLDRSDCVRYRHMSPVSAASPRVAGL